MKKTSQRRLRQAWMRRFRRAQESNGYRFHRTSPVQGGSHDAPVTYPGKLYILKDDGRTVMEVKDGKTGKTSYQIVNIGLSNTRVHQTIDGRLVSVV